MKILITGGAGYIGSKLCHLLAKRVDVEHIYAFDSLIYNQGHLTFSVHDLEHKISFFNEDVLDFSTNLEDAIEASDVIIPLAAIVGAPACDQVPDYATSINYDWYNKLLEKDLSDKIVIYPNTNSGYGSTGEELCTEETLSSPISLYARLKQDTEDLLIEKLPDQAICFRLATVFGWSFRPRLDLLVNNLPYRALFEGRLEIFDGHYRRNYIHVDDICHAFMFAIDNKERMVGQVFNLGNDQINMTKESLASTIAQAVGVEFSIDETRTDPDKRDYLVSSQKLYDLGFSPDLMCDLASGILEMINFYKHLPTDKDTRETLTANMFNY